MNPIWCFIGFRDLGLFCEIWLGRTTGSIKITGDAYQLTTTAAITGKGNVDRLKKLQNKSV